MPSDDPDREYILEGIKNGFRITDRAHSGPVVETNNYKSATEENFNEVENQIKVELENGRLEVTNTVPKITNALGAIVKQEGDKKKCRLLLDCSSPRGDSLNDLTDNWHVAYDDLAVAKDIIKPHNVMAKIDLQGAYKVVPIHPQDRHLTGIKWTFKNASKPTYFLERFLPFGARRSPFVFQRLSKAVLRIASNYGYHNIIVYLDDYLIISENTQECIKTRLFLVTLLRLLGYQIAYKKMEGPSKTITFLGVKICTESFTFSIPQQKIAEIIHKAKTIYSKKSVSKLTLQKLAGLLSWVSQIIKIGKQFTRRIFDSIARLQAPAHKTRVTQSIKCDLDWWLCFAGKFNGVARINNFQNECVSLASDACLIGGGAFHDGSFYYTDFKSWGDSISNLHINYKETLTVVPAFFIYGPSWRNKTVFIHLDNKAAVGIINKGTSHNPIVMHFLRLISCISVIYNFVYVAVYYRGSSNKIADSISRVQSPGGLEQLNRQLHSLLYPLEGDHVGALPLHYSWHTWPPGGHVPY